MRIIPVRNTFEGLSKSPFSCLSASSSWPTLEEALLATQQSSPELEKAHKILESLDQDSRALFLHSIDIGNSKALKKILDVSGNGNASHGIIEIVYKAIKEGVEIPLANTVDLEARGKAIPAKIKRKINDELHKIGLKKWGSIPLDEILWAARKFGLVAIQEDGTEWAGMLLGAAECGTDKARDQVAVLRLAIKFQEKWTITNACIYMAWCTTSWNPKRYEIVTYLT